MLRGKDVHEIEERFFGSAEARKLHQVVAEGAETDSDAVELFQLGCEYAQGYVFGEPMTAEAAKEMLLSEQLEPAR